ncbi:MAG TPA: CHAT domain-containing protein [Ktedonobacterales bacterium]
MDDASLSPSHNPANKPLPQPLREWLSQIGSYYGRRFLEQRCEILLTLEMERALVEEIASRAERAEDVDGLQERLAIMREARRRGGHIVAVRETYVDAKGGFTLDLPDWFDEVTGRFLDLSVQAPEETANARIELFTDALARAQVEHLPEEAIAELRNKRAIAYKDDSRGDRAEAVEAAIADHMAALQVYTRRRYPRQWALTRNNLGRAFSQRIAGDRADNLEQAIAHFRAALRVFKRAELLAEYATVLNNLGSAFQERISGSLRGNHERAIRYLRRALVTWTGLDASFRQTHVLYNLGMAYAGRIAGSRRDNLERAIEYFYASLELLASVDPAHDYSLIDYANTKNHLALAYIERIVGRPRDNVEEAIRQLTEVEGVLDPARVPVAWASTQHNLGLAYHGRVAGSKRDNLEEGRDHYLAALKVRTRALAPKEHANTQVDLGILYKDRISGDPRENIEAAIRCFRAALEIYSLSSTPLDYATTQNNLGGAYWSSRFGNRSNNIEQAIACFDEALTVYTQSGAAGDRAMALLNLGVALWSRIVGDRAANLERARVCIEEALTVYTVKASPDRHAVAQSNLGAIYLRRLEGTRADNLTRAAACFNKALDIYAVDKDSMLFRDAHLNLASLAFEGIAQEADARGDVEGLRTAYRDAHTHYRIARECQRNLGWLESDEQGRVRLQGAHHATRELYARDAWCLLRLGDMRSAIEALEEGRAQALFEAQQIAGALVEGVCAEHRAEYVAARQVVAEARAGTRAQRRFARDHLLGLRRAIQTHCAPGFLPDAAPYDEIACATAPDQALVYLAATEFGGFALVVPPRQDTQTPIPAPFEIPLPRLTWRVVDDWLRTPDEGNRVRAGFQLALQRQGMATLSRVLFQETEPATVMDLLGTPLRDLPDLLPASMRTLRVALNNAIRDIYGQLPAVTSETLSSSAISVGPPETPSLGEVFGDSDALRRLTRQLAWYYQMAELDALWPALQHDIVQPLRDGLVAHGLGGSDQRIAIVPCGRLGVFPLHAAPVCEGGPPLAETCELTYQASARTCKNARLALARLSAQGPIFAVGNPRHTSNNATLPHAGREAEAIAHIGRDAGYPASIAVVGPKATRSRVLAELQRFRETYPGAWFHCAGHGRASAYDPVESYMALSGFDAEGRPERLSLDLLQRQQVLSGIYGVTASGCVTGLGDMELAPDELSSFAAGLLQSGAVCVVSTLWSVKDYATSLLMTRFHHLRLRHPDTSPAIALREATRWLRTATRPIIDKFARESGLPCWADVDVTRDAMRGDVSLEAPTDLKREGMRESAPNAVAEDGMRSGNAPQKENIRATEMPLAELAPVSAGSGALYAHPVYWAAPIIVGAS